MSSVPLPPDLPENLHYAGIEEVGVLLRRRALSCVQLTEYMLERIARYDPHQKSYATVLADRARQSAVQMDAELADGKNRGPLHGVPVAVKDLCAITGVENLGGINARRGMIAQETATVVTRLEAAGAVILGTLNLTEGAMAGYQESFDIPLNPWGDQYWPGVSSSGSGVSVAAGLCYAAIGTDTGGSIRLPAMANGVVGLKPTYGRVSRHGVLDLAASMDHVGPLTRRSADAAIVLNAIAGADPADPTALDTPAPPLPGAAASRLDGVKIGYDAAFAALETNRDVVQAIEVARETLKSLSAEIVDLNVPTLAPEFAVAWFGLCAHEACAAHAAFFPSQAESYGNYFRDFLSTGAALSDEDLANAKALRSQVTADWTELVSEVDAFLCPVGGYAMQVTTSQYGGMAPLMEMLAAQKMEHTAPGNFSGLPSLTLPCGMPEAGGPPYVLQLYGSALSEAELCRIGAAFEGATDWHTAHPNI